MICIACQMLDLQIRLWQSLILDGY